MENLKISLNNEIYDFNNKQGISVNILPQKCAIKSNENILQYALINYIDCIEITMNIPFKINVNSKNNLPLYIMTYPLANFSTFYADVYHINFIDKNNIVLKQEQIPWIDIVTTLIDYELNIPDQTYKVIINQDKRYKLDLQLIV